MSTSIGSPFCAARTIATMLEYDSNEPKLKRAGRCHRSHPADPLQRDVLAGRDIIVDVGASLHLDRVAVLRGGNCGSNSRIRLPRTDAQDSHFLLLKVL